MPSIWIMVRELAWMISPMVIKVLKINEFPRDAIQFFKNAFTDIMMDRRNNGVIRNDLMQTLIQARTDLVVNKSEPLGKKIYITFMCYLVCFANV